LFAILYEFRFFSEILEKLIFFAFSNEKEMPEISFSKIVQPAVDEFDSRFFRFADFHLRLFKVGAKWSKGRGKFQTRFYSKI